MQRVEICLDRIVQVRAATQNVESAYLLRTRLNRMLLSIQRMVATDYGFDVVVPCKVVLPRDASPDAIKIAEITNLILLDSKHISQRSAALDDRWEKEWGELSGKLDLLESLLQER